MVTSRVRISDVAKAAGVSTATVSRALSHPDQVTEATRETVLAAVRDTGYRINRAARHLRTQKSGAVLVLTPNLSNAFFAQIIGGIEQIVARAGYSVLVADTAQMQRDQVPLIDVFLDGRADGVIVLDGYLPPESTASVAGTAYEHAVVYACEWSDAEGIPSVRTDNAGGARLAARHLAELGHVDVGHVTGPTDNVLTGVRRQAFLDEARQLGLNCLPAWVFDADFKLGAGAQAAEAFLAQSERPTGLFCASDMSAIGVVKTLLMRGVSVPDDVSVVGFDDVALAEFYHPSLTTIRQDRTALGEEAARILLARMAGETVSELPVIPVSLVARESSARRG